MELCFVSDGGDCEFPMEVGYFDSVLQIKEKIQKEKGIPIANQTLMFNGQILADEFNVHDSDLVIRSKIVVKIDPPCTWERETEVPVVFLDKNKNQLPPETTEIILKFPMSSELVKLINVDVNQTVSQLKFLITLRFQEMMTTPASRIRLIVDEQGEGLELEDSRTLHQCQIKKDSIVAVHLRSRKKLDFDDG